ncbi:helix-turn-helix transcriptional regulator [Croceicoccus sp. BE223]|uniref:helix-turn-helix transcriptional regulator n=1 Tax=Croceicoccus sp. BE223 TaxID=2817716 RepID=UPI00285B94FE|nr:helix-turn-helix transcriptional regulator [Croceicoccus sp. BE223]MDR7102385.1 DNA-binding CsgD family transcriptional regulator [Croceicoccus sp. BE223]
MQDADGNVLASTVFGWPTNRNQWWLKPQLALDSPLPIACRYESEPFWANIHGFHSRTHNPMLDTIELKNFEKLVHAPAVICIPIHQPFGQIGAVSFSRPESEQLDLSKEFEIHADSLERVSRRFVTSYSRLTCRRSRIPQNCRLTDREVVCLRWAAIGKTDAEIAQIIHRSCATVRFHIQNARGKLDAVNRSQTIFKAAQLGFLGSAAVTNA